VAFRPDWRLGGTAGTTSGTPTGFRTASFILEEDATPSRCRYDPAGDPG
jgi:hypothetical protein